jgi:hypothetical protein
MLNFVSTQDHAYQSEEWMTNATKSFTKIFDEFI